MVHSFLSTSAGQTKLFAEKLAPLLQSGDVLTLSGDLGAGKTTFTKGLAVGLGIERAVTSPTFTMIKEYKGKLPLYHMDAYRLEYSEEDIGFTEYFYGDGITVVEWATFIEQFLPENRLDIRLEYVDETTRKLILRGMGMHFSNVIEKITLLKGITE